MNWKAMLNDYRRWYTERAEFMKERGLEEEFWNWKVKKGYRKPEGGLPESYVDDGTRET